MGTPEGILTRVTSPHLRASHSSIAQPPTLWEALKLGASFFPPVKWGNNASTPECNMYVMCPDAQHIVGVTLTALVIIIIFVAVLVVFQGMEGVREQAAIPAK